MEDLKSALKKLLAEDKSFLRSIVLDALANGGSEAIVDIILKDPNAKLKLLSEIAGSIVVPLNVATKEDIKQLDSRLASLEAGFAQLRSQVTSLEGRVTSLEGKFESLEGSVQRLENRVESLERRVDSLERRVESLEGSVQRLEGRVESLEGRVDSLEREVKELKHAFKRLEVTISGLGARWGLINEETFREGVRSILSDVGWTTERVVIRDEEGYVHGEPGDVEYDVVIKDGVTIVVEITSSIKRGDLPVLERKKALFEKARGPVAAFYVITPFIHDKKPEALKAAAERRGLKIVYPTPED